MGFVLFFIYDSHPIQHSKAALIISGNPIFRPHFKASEVFETAFGVAGKVGTFALSAAFLAATLSPILSRSSGRGPIKVIPASAHALAKSAFSDKKPYPGESYQHLSLANEIIESISR